MQLTSYSPKTTGTRSHNRGRYKAVRADVNSKRCLSTFTILMGAHSYQAETNIKICNVESSNHYVAFRFVCDILLNKYAFL
jgi:hypothetical protein